MNLLSLSLLRGIQAASIQQEAVALSSCAAFPTSNLDLPLGVPGSSLAVSAIEKKSGSLGRQEHEASQSIVKVFIEGSHSTSTAGRRPDPIHDGLSAQKLPSPSFLDLHVEHMKSNGRCIPKRTSGSSPSSRLQANFAEHTLQESFCHCPNYEDIDLLQDTDSCTQPAAV